VSSEDENNIICDYYGNKEMWTSSINKPKNFVSETIKPQIKGIGGCWGLDRKDSFDMWRPQDLNNEDDDDDESERV